ncbi:MAG: hypothetical protein BAJALOKI1v1_510007 [Promethearchaeota archaeon]|nr:MAG: hypothetical protein BAJALOKI1v1_510007 [Candidatus Lokiarchaeota archaeon]
MNDIPKINVIATIVFFLFIVNTFIFYLEIYYNVNLKNEI